MRCDDNDPQDGAGVGVGLHWARTRWEFQGDIPIECAIRGLRRARVFASVRVIIIAVRRAQTPSVTCKYMYTLDDPA